MPDSRGAASGATGTRGARPYRRDHLPDVLRRRATAAAQQVQPARRGELGHDRGELFGRLVVLAHRVRQARVRVAPRRTSPPSPPTPARTAASPAPQRTVQPHGQRPRVAHGVVERLRRLARQRPPRRIGDRRRQHQRQRRSPPRRSTAGRRRCPPSGSACRSLSRAAAGPPRPSTSASACSRYTSTSWSNVTARYAGFPTSGEIEAVRGVGPIAPAIHTGRPGVRAPGTPPPPGAPAPPPPDSAHAPAPPGRIRPVRCGWR